MKKHGSILVLYLLFAITAITASIGYNNNIDSIDGIHNVQFKLYSSQKSEYDLWSETHETVEFRNGSYFVELGSINPMISLDSETDYYIEIIIDGEVSHRELFVYDSSEGIFTDSVIRTAAREVEDSDSDSDGGVILDEMATSLEIGNQVDAVTVLRGTDFGIGLNTGVDPLTTLDVREGSGRFWDGTATITYATAEGELYVENDLEVDNTIYGSHYRGNAGGDLLHGGTDITVSEEADGSWTIASTATGSDDQNLSLSGTTLNIEDGSGVSLASFMDNTDTQDLSISDHTISLVDGGSVTVPDNYNADNAPTATVRGEPTRNEIEAWANGVDDDNYADALTVTGTTTKTITIGRSGALSDLTATFTDSGGDSDWTVSGSNQYSAVSGNVGIGTSSPYTKLEVNGDISVPSGDGYRFITGGTGWEWGIGRDLISATANGIDIVGYSGNFQVIDVDGTSGSYTYNTYLDIDMSTGLVTIGNTDIEGDLTVDGMYIDSDGDGGSSGQVLTSTGTGTNWAAASGADTDWTIGSGVIYNSGNEVAIGTTTSDGHGLNVEHYTSGTGAVRGTDGTSTIYAEGLLGVLSYSGLPLSVTNIGVLGLKPNNGGNGAAVYAWNNDDNSSNYAVYANANGSSGTNYGIYSSASSGSASYAGYFNGNVRITGRLYDSSGDVGTSGQVLTSTGTGTNWAAASGGSSLWTDHGTYVSPAGGEDVYSDGEFYTPSGYGIIHHGATGLGGSASGWTPDHSNGQGVWLENAYGEGGGFYADGNIACVWSPGDGALFEVYDEDILSSGPEFTIDGAGNVLPGDNDNVHDLGSTAYSWNDLFIDGAIYIDGSRGSADQALMTDGTSVYWGDCCSGGTATCDDYNESFESGFGEWTNVTGDDADWTRNSGSTSSSSTGPTSAQNGTYYVYCETSSPISNGDNFYLQTSQTMCSAPSIQLYYHMYFSTWSDGTLQLQVSTTGGSSWGTIWSDVGNQGTSWQSTTRNLSTYAGDDVILRFVFTVGSNTSYQYDCALDNITIYDVEDGTFFRMRPDFDGEGTEREILGYECSSTVKPGDILMINESGMLVPADGTRPVVGFASDEILDRADYALLNTIPEYKRLEEERIDLELSSPNSKELEEVNARIEEMISENVKYYVMPIESGEFYANTRYDAKAGDLLTFSDTPGSLRKLSDKETGKYVAVALENQEENRVRAIFREGYLSSENIMQKLEMMEREIEELKSQLNR